MSQKQKRLLRPTDALANDLLYHSACGEDGLIAFVPGGIVIDGALDTPEYRKFLEENGVTIEHSEERMCG